MATQPFDIKLQDKDESFDDIKDFKDNTVSVIRYEKGKPQKIYWYDSYVTFSRFGNQGQEEEKLVLRGLSSGMYDIKEDEALYITEGKVKVVDI